MNLKSKLVLLFLVSALIPLGIIGVLSLRITENIIVSMAYQQLENIATDKAVILEKWLGERKADLKVFSDTSILKSMDASAIAEYLGLVQQHYGVYKDITVVDDQGGVVYSTLGISSINTDTGLWSGQSGEQPLFKSGVSYLPQETESTFHLAMPIFDGGEFRGAVYGTVGTAGIITSILTISLGQTGECYLVDRNGTFLAHKEPHRILKDNISQSESFRNIFLERDPKQTYLDYRNIEVTGTFRKVGGTDWYLVVEQDRDEAFQSLSVLRNSIWFAILLCFGGAFLIAVAISSYVVRPIRQLSETADSIANSNYPESKLRTERRDEIGVLYRAFENMSARVRERQESLEEKVSMQDAVLKDTDMTLKQIKLIAERSEKFAAIGRLGASVAHEIRTPLTSLKLFLESVQSEVEISREYEEDYGVAMGQIRRMEAAINRFLEFSKPRELNFAVVDCGRLIEETAALVRPMANRQECRLEVSIEAGLPSIVGDKQFLEEALINLMMNSIEAIDGPGLLDVSARRGLLLSGERQVECVRIDIRDSGPGIADEHVKLVFEPFFTTKTSGTGLGLPLVLNTVKRHNGVVEVKNHRGGGAVFSLFLPLEQHGADHG
jgi:two-component system, NtrC family, sensor kinase